VILATALVAPLVIQALMWVWVGFTYSPVNHLSAIGDTVGSAFPYLGILYMARLKAKQWGWYNPKVERSPFPTGPAPRNAVSSVSAYRQKVSEAKTLAGSNPKI
jgi:hypothetical protein